MPVSPGIIAAVGGTVLLLLLVFQVLAGKRIIKLGRNHSKIHRWVAYAMVVFSLFHGVAGVWYFVILPQL